MAAPSSEIRRGERLTRLGEWGRSLGTSGPGIFWVTVFLLVPLVGIGVMSFMSRGTYGEVQGPATLSNYARLLGFGLLGFDPQYPKIILRSLLMGAGTTLVCLLAAFPLAFFIAGLEGRKKQIALTLVVIPFWTNLLIRTYAWQILLGPESFLAKLATAVGLADAGQPLYPSVFAVYIGMLCAYLPFLVLPLYTSVEKIDWSIAEAAADLGADGPRVFRHALLPQVLPGMVAGIILVFIPATGQFVVPDLLGGAKTAMLGNAIQQQFGPSRDWPFGSAIAFVGMAVVMTGLWLNARLAARRGEESLL
ncbi:MAG: ABC transporter permease [Thermoanaerobaculia bacterium]|nr:ABC transporter permease [Thermoanaerobaculia bacterium]